MLIGQEFKIFGHVEAVARLGDRTTLPPNLRVAEEPEFWRLLAAERHLLTSRQPAIDWLEWHLHRRLKPGTTQIPNVRLFTRPDLSGILIVLDHQHATAPNDPINGVYRPYLFSFAACRHMTITRSSSTVQSGERVECAECGFWTRVTSD